MKEKKEKGLKAKLIATNMVTAIRFAGAIAILPVFLKYGGLVAAGLLTGVFITDAIDGMMARKFGTSTFFGAALDASADKAAGIISLIALLFATNLAIIPILSELLILGVNIAKYKNKQNVQSSFLGKLKTCALSLGIILAFGVNGLVNQNIIAKENILNYMLPIFLGMVPFELATLVSYLKDFNKNKKIENSESQIEQEKQEENKENKKLERIKEKRALLEQKKEYLKEYYKNKSGGPIFDPDFYKEHKDDQDFNLYLKAHYELQKERKGFSRSKTKRD